MCSLRDKIRTKWKVNLKNETDRIINLLEKNKIQSKTSKIRKHCSLSTSVFKNYHIEDNKIFIHHQTTDNKYSFYLLKNDNNRIYSYSLSDMNIEQHKDYIIEQLNIYLNRINCFDYIPKIIKKYNTNDETFLKINGDLSNCNYEEIYIINILPPTISILSSNKICNSYIVTYSKQKIVNIFYCYDYHFNIPLINNFNKDKVVTYDNLSNVILNYMAFQISDTWTFGNVKYKINYIEEPFNFRVPLILNSISISTQNYGMIQNKNILDKSNIILNILKNYK